MAIPERDTRGIGRSDFRLPADNAPAERRCIKLYLPDDPEHLRIVAGVLNQLTEARNWRGGTESERDETASMYDEILDEIPWEGECDVPTFRFTLECGLEFSLDGETWTPVEGWDTFSALCYTGATGPPGEDGTDGATLFIRDTGNGQVQTSPDSAVWTDVTNAKYLHINADNDPLIGGLTIQSTDSANPSLIVIEPIATPTVALVSYRKSDSTPIWEILSNLRARFYGSTGNITLDQAGNDINFSRVGANFLSAITAPATLIMRVGGKESVTAHQNGRSTFGHIEQRDATMDALSQNVAWPILSLRAITSQSGNIAEFKTAAATISAIAANGSGKLLVNDGGVNSAPNGLILGHDIGASTPLANFGVSLRFQGKSSTTVEQDMALLRAVWETPTHASRKAQVVLSAFDTGEREVMRGGANGSAASIGFLGATPSPVVDVGTVDCIGNAGAKSALDVLVNFGLITGTINLGTAPDPPDPPETLPSLTRCQYAVSTAKMMFYHFYVRMAEHLEFLDLGLSVFDREDYLERILEVQRGAYDDWHDFMVRFFTDYGQETDHSGYLTHVADMETHFLTIGANHFYCFMDDLGVFSSGQFDAMLGEIASETGTSDIYSYFYDFMQIWNDDRMSIFTGLAEHSRYIYDADCLEFDCDNWEVLMTTASPDVEQITGSSDELAWFFEGAEGTLILQVQFFHVTSIHFVCQTDDDTPPAEIRAKEYGGSVWHNFTPTGGANDVDLAFDAPNGVEIEVSIDSGSGTPSIQIRELVLHGVGTPIPDGG